MLARKQHDDPPKALPKEWEDQVLEILNSVYAAQCIQKNLKLEIFGEIYPSELLLIVTLSDKDDDGKIPTSCFLSINLSQDAPIPKGILPKLIDALGCLMDDVFAQDQDSQAPIDLWNDAKFKELAFFYKINRENVALTIRANQLLNQ
jgi:hypothetical protein